MIILIRHFIIILISIIICIHFYEPYQLNSSRESNFSPYFINNLFINFIGTQKLIWEFMGAAENILPPPPCRCTKLKHFTMEIFNRKMKWRNSFYIMNNKTFFCKWQQNGLTWETISCCQQNKSVEKVFLEKLDFFNLRVLKYIFFRKKCIIFPSAKLLKITPAINLKQVSHTSYKANESHQLYIYS